MLAFVLMLIAAIIFVLAASKRISTTYDLLALGLAFAAISVCVTMYPG